MTAQEPAQSDNGAKTARTLPDTLESRQQPLRDAHGRYTAREPGSRLSEQDRATLDATRVQLMALAGDSPTRRLVAEQASTVYAVILELRANVNRFGALTATGKIRGSTRELIKWQAELVKLLNLLGLDQSRKATDPTAQLNAYIERRAAERGERASNGGDA